jgi:hypothetical protein
MGKGWSLEQPKIGRFGTAKNGVHKKNKKNVRAELNVA